MPIIFTDGLTPNLTDATFDTEKEHVKQIFTLLNGGNAYVNVLETPLANLISRIDTLTTELETDANIASAELGSASTPDTLLFYSDDAANLPDGWTSGGSLTITDMAAIASSVSGYISANNTIRTNLATLKTFINTADDDFKLHNDLLSGVRDSAPNTEAKPNLQSLMSMVSSITSMEHRFGVPFVNYLEKVFGTLFTGDVTISDAQTFLDTNPIPVTYASLGVLSSVQADPYTGSPSGIATSVNDLLGSSTYAATVLTHKDNFQTHITNDTNEYDSLVDKLYRYVKAYGVTGYLNDDYYKFMYTDVFGSAELVQIINDRDNGVID